MKFIKTADGWYVDKNKIDWLCIGEICENVNTSALTIKICVFAYVLGVRCRLKEFVCNSKSEPQFDRQAEAQAWLDNFVAELNAEEI